MVQQMRMESRSDYVPETGKKDYEKQIQVLEKQYAEIKKKYDEAAVQVETLNQNLRMEQDTSNNLIVSIQGSQTQIENLEERNEKLTKRVEGRDLLISQLEAVIKQLTEQVQRDQGLLKIAEEKAMQRTPDLGVDVEPTEFSSANEEDDDHEGDVEGQDKPQISLSQSPDNLTNEKADSKRKTRNLEDDSLGNVIRVRAKMPDYRQVVSQTDRRASFEIISIMATNPEALLVETQLAGDMLKNSVLAESGR